MYRATTALVCINAVMGTLALVGFAYAIAVVSLEGRLCVNCLAIPIEWGWAAFGLTLGILLISIFAIVAAYKHVRSMLIFMSFFTFITFAISVALTVIILLFITQGNLGALQGTVDGLEGQLKSFLAIWASEHPADWVGVQAGLGCCGVDLKATYDFIATWPTVLHTGPKCNATVDAVILQAQTSFPNFTFYQQDPQLLVTTNNQIVAANQGHAYFCEQAVKLAAQSSAVVVGVILSLLSALQFLAFALSCFLLCGVKEEDGGFGKIDEETGQLQSPLKAFISAPSEVAQDTKAFANRVSTRIGMNVAPVANRVSMRMGFSPMFTPPTDYPPLSVPPPGMPPPGMFGGGGGFGSGGGGGGGGGGGTQKDWGAKYEKYVRMKKSGLPIGAVQNAMVRDRVDIPDGFLDEEVDDGPSKPAGRGGFGAPPPGPPPFQAMKNLANRVSMNLQKSSNRVSMNMKGMFGGGFSPPPPPPGFGQLPTDGMNNSFGGASSFGGATNNPSYGSGAGPGRFSAQTVPEEPVPSLPPMSRAPPPKAAKAPPAPKPTKSAPPKKAPAKKGGGGGGAGFLADIAGANGSTGGSAFGLKKTVTNDRSAPNFSA